MTEPTPKVGGHVGPGYAEALELARFVLGTARAWVVVIDGLPCCFLTMPDGEGDFLIASADSWPELMKRVKNIGSACAAVAKCRDLDKKAAGG